MDTSLLNSISESDIEKFKLIAEIFNQTNKVEAITLRVFADEYSNFIKQNRSAAYHTSVTISLNHLTNFFGKQRSIQSIGLKDLENFITDLQQKVKKGYRVYYKTLKAAFNKAIEWGYLKENYFLKVKLSKKQRVNPAYISGDQLLVISDWLETNSRQYAVGSKQMDNNIVTDIVVFAFYTGMRLNEIVNLTWRNVDLTGRVITVGDESFTTKGRNQRYIPICEEAFEILVRREKRETRSLDYSSINSELRLGTGVKGETGNGRGQNSYPRLIDLKNKVGDSSPDFIGIRMTNEYVFCKNDGKKFTGDYVSKKFKQACKTAGIDKAIHFHSLRHSFASNLAQKGVSLYVIKELLGHSSISTTEIYSHLNMDSLREAIGKFDASPMLSTGTSAVSSTNPSLCSGHGSELRLSAGVKGERGEVRSERGKVKGETGDGHSIAQIITIKNINGGL